MTSSGCAVNASRYFTCSSSAFSISLHLRISRDWLPQSRAGTRTADNQPRFDFARWIHHNADGIIVISETLRQLLTAKWGAYHR